MVGFFVVAVLIFLGLTARLVFLGSSNVERVAGAHGLEVEMFRQYPASAETGAAPARPGQVRVPALAGRGFREAGDALARLGLSLEGIGDTAGSVVRQEPAAGRTVRQGTAVRVWLEVR